MPQPTREFDNVRRFLGIKANDERRGVNRVDNVGVVGVRSEVLIVLENTEQKSRASLRDTHLSPNVSIRRGQRTNGRVFVSCVIQDVFNLPVEGLAPARINTSLPTLPL